MLFYISVLIIGWLSVGFLMGLKLLYFDRVFDKKVKPFNPANFKESEVETAALTYELLSKNKLTFLALATLAGVVPLIAEIYASILIIKKRLRK